MKKVAVIRGDGIGPEVVQAALSVLAAAGFGPQGPAKAELVECRMGLAVYREEGTPLTDDTFAALESADAILLGAIMTPPEPDPGYRSGLLRIRRELDLYANVRPALTLPGVPGACGELDLVIVRENTEGLYFGGERELTGDDLEDVEGAGGKDAGGAKDSGGEPQGEEGDEVVQGAEAIRRITRGASRRVARRAFALAREQGRTRVTAVHKANVMPLTEGIFLDACREVAGENAEAGITLDTMLVDAMAADLVRRPGGYQVLVTTNMFGDILSDLAAQLAGGLGLAPSANLGDRRGLFEPVHGSAPDIAGKGVANPTGCILSGAMMLEYLEFREPAERVRGGLLDVLKAGEHLTPDVGGTGTTEGFTAAVIHAVSGR
jgi:isocitrate/isopropylmalate dehydrogenase